MFKINDNILKDFKIVEPFLGYNQTLVFHLLLNVADYIIMNNLDEMQSPAQDVIPINTIKSNNFHKKREK